MKTDVQVLDVHGTILFTAVLGYEWTRALQLRAALCERTAALDGCAGFTCAWEAFKSIADEAAL